MQSKTTAAKELEALRKQEAAGASVMAARNAIRKGERERAKELIKEAFAANPGDIAAIELLGDMYLEDGETGQALKVFERAMKVHPEHVAFEEKAAVCRLDLAEMENDRILRTTVLELGDQDKIFERSVGKAVGLSVMVPGAGQFYNDENERGIAYMATGLLTFVAWTYPIMGALSNKENQANFFYALHSLTGFQSFVFYVGATIWAGIYAASITGAANSAKRFNLERQAALGLLPR